MTFGMRTSSNVIPFDRLLDFDNEEDTAYYIIKTIKECPDFGIIIFEPMSALVDDLVGKPSGEQLLDLMVHNGKKLYILDHLLPNAPDSLKFLYPNTQVKWCYDNEAKIWSSFTTKNVLFSSRLKDIQTTTVLAARRCRWNQW